MSAFIDMGGYASFVWPAYGITALAIGAVVVVSLRSRRILRRKLERLEASSEEVEA